MSLNSLPPELIINIVENLDPFSSFDVARTNTSWWELCKPILKHKRLMAENRTIDAHDSAYPRKNFILWEKLREILDNPTIGEYVRSISLPSSRATYLQADAAHDFELSAEAPQPSKDDLDRYAVVTERMVDLYGPGFSNDLSWDGWILKGSSEPIITMLVHCMPYLESFRFTALEMHEVFMKFLQRVVMAYTDPAVAPKLPFQHLTTVAVAHWDTEGSCGTEWCLLFCAIPTVRNFLASARGGARLG